MNKIGTSIEIWIEEPNWVILDGWCKVFHQFTENFMIGILIKPMQIKIDPISAEKSLKRIAPKYINSSIKTDVNRASQTQKVPHIGFPQKHPVNKVNKVNKVPTWAPMRENKFNIGCFVTKNRKLVILIIR